METANYHECKECRWSVKKEKGVYECHRFPPVSFGDKYGRFGWEFPLVCEDADDCFCGEQERTEKANVLPDDLGDAPPMTEDIDFEAENTPRCRTCRWSVEKNEQGRRYFVCHCNPPVQRNDPYGQTRYEFPVVNGMDEECFCGEYEEEPEIAE